MPPLKVVFMGTPDFAVPTLEALLAAGIEVPVVYTQPPRAAGRGKKLRPGPVQQAAEAHGIPVRTPTSLKDPDEQAAFAAIGADAAVVVAYGLILPEAVLAAPKLGCLNLHGSRLPRWRGAAPVQRAIMAGDRETAATAMLMDAGLDTGPILLEAPIAITDETTAGDLHDRMAEVGAELMVDALTQLAAGTAVARPQPETGATYAAKIDKDEAHIDWSRPADEVLRHIHGLSPFPGAWFDHAGTRVKVLRAARADGCGPAGTVLDDELTIACGDGAVRLLHLQRAGKAAMAAAAFLRGVDIPAGTVLT